MEWVADFGDAATKADLDDLRSMLEDRINDLERDLELLREKVS